ncbi:MAG: hypothetical protein ABSA59_18225, partial [Terriglobia bacterium]
GVLGPRPLAWAEVVRPFGARLGISSISTPGVQQKMWDTISGGRGGTARRWVRGSNVGNGQLK